MLDRTADTPLEAQGRIAGLDPIGVIDIGSNSVRLVAYEGLSRAPTQLYNEKVLCGLGHGVALTGRLDDAAIGLARRALLRFAALARQLGVSRLIIVATAAVREAENGADFVALVEELCQAPVRVLSGEEEAHYAALGVVSGFHKPRGVAGDLGGGSLELSRIDGTEISDRISMPLGALRLADLSNGNVDKARSITARMLDAEDLPDLKSKLPFYAIGGTWRAFATLHMEMRQYPLRILQNYRIKAKHATALAREIARGGMNELPGIEAVSTARRQLLPFGAVILDELLKRISARSIMVSAFGVREGLLYEALDPAIRDRDPLLSATRDLSVLRSRSPEFSAELCAWTDALIAAIGEDETADERRSRHAACWLADIGWRAHPDYRGEQSLNIIANASFSGIDHPGRAFLALTVFFRHGYEDEQPGPRLRSLVNLRVYRQARTLGAAMRVAYRVSGSMPGVLSRLQIERSGKTLRLIGPPDLEVLVAERVESRFKKLAKAYGLSAEISVRKS